MADKHHNNQQQDNDDNEQNDNQDVHQTQKQQKSQKDLNAKKGQQQQQQQQHQQQQQNKFESIPLREYYDHSITAVLMEGLRELGKTRPENPIKFLGQFLLDRDPEKKK